MKSAYQKQIVPELEYILYIRTFNNEFIHSVFISAFKQTACFIFVKVSESIQYLLL